MSRRPAPRARALAAALALLALAGAACDGDAPTPPATATPTAASDDVPRGFHPHDVRTGVPAVDAVIDAIYAGGPAALAGLVTMSPVPCVDPGAPATGEPPLCGPGEAPGTPAEAFPLGVGCQVRYLRTREEAAAILTGARLGSLHLYAVFEGPFVQLDPGAAFYGIILGGRPGDYRGATLFVAREGGIVGMLGVCSDFREQLPRAGGLILAPRSP